NKTVKIGVNPKFSFILNELTSNFTRFELQEFLNLKSKYTKECYRRLKQYRKSGIWSVEIEEFRRILGVPESYEMKDLTKRVLKPIQEELSPIFNNSQIEKIKKKGAYSGRGNKVTHIVFTFEKDNEIPYTVRVNGNKSKLSSSERDIWKDLEIEENKELNGQLDFINNVTEV
ncbi:MULTISPECIES: replication initiation protein, partial [unclassified Desulfovibrio]|uniref:replication initiation protein n=1 Tax=unclassified Desulfovibrio TaxID=2593640 RepID=UPI000FBDE57C